jgi:tetratricopeptide (TPR) repeat protein
MESSESTEFDVELDAPPSDLEDERIRAVLGARLFGREEVVTIDRFELGERLGSGGLGVVYRAKDPVLQRAVALKVVRPDRSSEALRDSLLREARFAAKLQHPNVVTVFEAGAQDDTVWIAMELVEGPTLRSWLSTPRRWQEIVALFVSVGQGLAEAHRLGVVHRDFKPENVLVESRPDGGVRPRVADFGVAVPDPERLRDTSVPVAGTPAYMAPEQLLGEAVDGRADQFAFCVALHEALSGERPARAERLTTQSRVTEPGAASSPPPAVERRWPRWLHGVVMRGLEADPSKRFASMDALLEALQRGLERRRRRFTLAGGSVVLGVAVAIAVVRSPDPCAGVRDSVVEVWNPQARAGLRAWMQPERGPFWQESADAVDAGVDAWMQRWGDAREDACRASQVERRQSDELRDLRDSCLDRTLGEVGGWISALQMGDVDATAVGKAVSHLGRLPDLDACADSATLLRELPFSGDAVRRAELEELWDSLAVARGMSHAGHWDQAGTEALLAEAEALEYPPVVAAAARLLATDELTHGDRETAKARLEMAYRQAIRGRADRLSGEVALLRAWTDLEGRTDLEEGKRWLDDAKAFIAAVGDPPVLRSTWLDHAGVLAVYEGRYTDAEALHREALALRNEVDAGSIAALQSRGNLGIALLRQHRLDDAKVEFEAARDQTARSMGAHHPQVGKLENNLAAVLQRLGDHEGSLQALNRALDIKVSVFGADHPAVASSLVNRANARWAMEDQQGSLDDLKRAIEIRATALGDEHPSLLTPLANLAFSLVEMERYEEALSHASRAVSVALAAYDDAHPEVTYARRAVAMSYVGLERMQEAADTYAAIVPHLGSEPPCDQFEVLSGYAGVARSLGASEQADTLAKRAAALAEANVCTAG